MKTPKLPAERSIKNAPEPIKAELQGLQERGILENPVVRASFLSQARALKAESTANPAKSNGNPRS